MNILDWIRNNCVLVDHKRKICDEDANKNISESKEINIKRKTGLKFGQNIKMYKEIMRECMLNMDKWQEKIIFCSFIVS